jgi:diguanylate cyclase (GGDEF)-like protein
MEWVPVRKDDAVSHTVLLIEDNSPNAAVVQQALVGDGFFVVERVRKCSEAQERLCLDRETAVAAVIANLFLPDSQGLQTVARIFEVAPHIPLLVLTNADNEHVAKQAIRRGAQDYVLQHRLDRYLLPKILQNMLDRAATAEEVAKHESARIGLSSVADAVRDCLTGLPNLLLLTDRLSQAIAFARRQQRTLAVLCVNIDRFKHVNYALGNEIGDHLLRSLAGRLLASVRASDTVSCLGGDEFVVLLSGLAHADDAAVSAQKILASLGKPHCIEKHDLQVTASIGIAVYPDNGGDAEMLVKNARNAMLSAKEHGHDGYGFVSPHLNEFAIERRFLECGLRQALHREEFVLFYEPQIDLRTEAIVGADAMIRWCRPNRGIALPAEFMSVAEQAGYSIQIGLWALREACRQARRWRDADLAPIPVSVDVSAIELRSKGFVDGVRAILSETGIEPQLLELEITEQALVDGHPSTAAVLHALRDMGVQVALDQFGTGHSSLTLLRRFPLDALRIDESLVRTLHTHEGDDAIVNAVIGAGRSFHLRVIAKGIETREQFLALQDLQCREGQGPYFREPVPADEFARLLRFDGCTTIMA